MVLSPRQFKDHLTKKLASAYDKQAGRYLDFMDRQGVDIKHGIDEQLANIEKWSR